MENIKINTSQPPRMRTIKQTAAETGFPAHAIRELVRNNKIVYKKIGVKVLVNVDRFIDYLNGYDMQSNDNDYNSYDPEK